MSTLEEILGLPPREGAGDSPAVDQARVRALLGCPMPPGPDWVPGEPLLGELVDGVFVHFGTPGKMFELIYDDPDDMRADPMRWFPSCEPRPSWRWLW